MKIKNQFLAWGDVMKRLIIALLLCYGVAWPGVQLCWAESEQQAPSTVGEERREEKKATRPATTVEKGGTLLPSWRFVIEPSFEYDHISGQNVSISGWTVFEAVLIGQLAIEKLKRDIFIPGVTFRLGLKDAELNMKVPYFIRSDQMIRPAQGDPSRVVEKDISDSDIGDLEFYFYYHLLKEGRWRSWVPDTIVRIGMKAPTGKDPYHLHREAVPEFGGLVIPTEFPTGTGHWGTSAGVTFIKSVDPAVIFLNLAYYYNFERDVGTVNGINFGNIKLGNSFEYSIGLIFALQERLSLNFALNQRLTGKTEQNGSRLADTQINAVSFNIGATYVVSPRLTFDFVVGIGLSQDAPDVSVLLRMPISVR